MDYRPAHKGDAAELLDLISYEFFIHRHLDWRSPLDWLDQQPFWVMVRNNHINAALALPPEPPGVYWIRSFACSAQFKPAEVFHELLSHSIHQLHEEKISGRVVSLAMQAWFGNLLLKNGFRYHQDIVVLVWEGDPQPMPPLQPSMVIRPMLPSDLPSVTSLDQACFEDIWQMTLNSLQHAFGQASYASVVEWDHRIVAYQISTSSSFSAHLARIAVHPGLQGKGTGRAVLQDLLNYFSSGGIHQVTVNTQSNNQASLALYRSSGFTLTEESYPVYVLPFGAGQPSL